MTFVLSLLPIAVLVAALVVVKAPAWKAALAALAVGAAEALFWRGMPAGEFARCAAQGVSTGETVPVQADGATLTLDAPKNGLRRFYRMKVSPRGN